MQALAFDFAQVVAQNWTVWLVTVVLILAATTRVPVSGSNFLAFICVYLRFDCPFYRRLSAVSFYATMRPRHSPKPI